MQNNQAVIELMNQQATKRGQWRERNWYYYEDLVKFFRYNVSENSRLLEIGCGDGYLLNQLKPKYGVGIDVSSGMIEQAKKNYPTLNFSVMDAEELQFSETFDYIILFAPSLSA